LIHIKSIYDSKKVERCQNNATCEQKWAKFKRRFIREKNEVNLKNCKKTFHCVTKSINLMTRYFTMFFALNRLAKVLIIKSFFSVGENICAMMAGE
jgi:hypothetical protein